MWRRGKGLRSLSSGEWAACVLIHGRVIPWAPLGLRSRACMVSPAWFRSPPPPRVATEAARPWTWYSVQSPGGLWPSLGLVWSVGRHGCLYVLPGTRLRSVRGSGVLMAAPTRGSRQRCVSLSPRHGAAFVLIHGHIWDCVCPCLHGFVCRARRSPGPAGVLRQGAV